jgi:hypothetical protein
MNYYNSQILNRISNQLCWDQIWDQLYYNQKQSIQIWYNDIQNQLYDPIREQTYIQILVPLHNQILDQIDEL